MLWKGRYPPNGQKVGKKGGRGGYPQKCQKVPFLGGSKGGKRGKKGGEGGVPSKTPTFGLKKGGVAGI